MQQPDSAPDYAFFKPLTVFVETMQAARDLDKFISENATLIGDVERLFAAEAKRRYPGAPPEQHERAASIVHKSVHATMRDRDRLKAEGASEEEIRESRKELLQQLREDLLELTGRPEYYGWYGPIWRTVATRREGTK